MGHAERDGYTLKIEELQGETDSLQERITALEGENSILKKEISDKQAEFEERQRITSVERAQEEESWKNKLSSQLSTAAAERADSERLLNEEISRLKNQLESAEKEKTAAVLAAKAAEDGLDAVKKASEEAILAAETAKKELQVADEERTDLRKRYQELLQFCEGDTVEKQRMRIIREQTLLKEISELKTELNGATAGASPSKKDKLSLRPL